MHAASCSWRNSSIMSKFSWVHAQLKHGCAISENRAEKVGEKKLTIFDFLEGFFWAEILIVNQILF